MKRRWFSRLGAAALCVMLLLSLVPATAAAAGGTDEIVGEWIWSSTVADAGADGAAEIIGRCSDLGVTDVYLLVKGTAGTISWLKTDYTDSLARTDRDILQEVIDAAHPLGIRVHAWLCNLEDAAYKAAHPEAGVWHYVRKRDNNIINPYDEGYRAYMCDLVTELVTNYDIDGLHFDYIRYNHAANGWGETDIASLEAMGADIDHLKELIGASFYDGEGQTVFEAYNSGDKDALILAQYRRNNVVDYAELLIDAAKEADPSIIISAALQPDGATDPAFGNIHYGQSYEDAADLYDYILPMAYSADFSQDSDWVADVAEAAIDAGNRVVVGLQAYSPVTTAQLLSDIGAVESLRAETGGSVLGFALFRNGTFGSAKVDFDTAEGVMEVSVTSPEAVYTWIQVELADGLAATSCEAVSGLDAESVEISADGKTVRLSGETLLPACSDGVIRIKFDGEPGGGSPALVRAGAASESRVFNAYEDITPPEPTVPEPHEITIANTANGTVDTSLSNASAGAVITITATPNSGYGVSGVAVTGPNGAVDVTRVDANTYTFVMPDGPVTVSVTFGNGLPFTDVSAGQWFYGYVEYVYANGLMNGTSATTFEPNANMTRAMVWAILARIDGETVTGESWQTVARTWAMANGVSDGSDPNGLVTREQFATMLWRYAGEPASTYSLESFTDANSVSDWAETAVAWAVEHGVITGMTDTTLVPQGTATRAQCAAMLMRYCAGAEK